MLMAAVFAMAFVPRDVEIVARDYAFAAPTQLSAGQTTFRFTNDGMVVHELHIILLKDGTTSQSVMAAVNARVPLKPLLAASVGILGARPGHRSSSGLSTTLVAGRSYLLICRVKDSASVLMHSQMGMIAVITVV